MLLNDRLVLIVWIQLRYENYLIFALDLRCSHSLMNALSLEEMDVFLLICIFKFSFSVLMMQTKPLNYSMGGIMLDAC